MTANKNKLKGEPMAKKKQSVLEHDFSPTVGDIVRDLIWDRRLTITAACKKMGISRESYRAVYNGVPVGYRVAKKIEVWANDPRITFNKLMGE